jgi:nucleoside 2-deoxyribosyltransferase
MREVRIVYLSGPITGLSQSAARNWRQHVSNRLAPGLIAVDPMRDAVDETIVSDLRLDDAARLEHLRHGKEILDRNRADIARCDLVLANLLGADRASIGAIGEVFWADAFRKPVIVVREPHGNIHDHGMINAIAARTFDDLDTAIDKINAILG